jgi:hypothetical protein
MPSSNRQPCCKYFRTLIWLIISAITFNRLGAQPQQPPSDLANLFSTIQAQEASFPLPNTSATITIGTLDLTPIGKIGHVKPTFTFSVPTYPDGSYYTIYESSVSDDFPRVGRGIQPARAVHISNMGAQVSVANILHLSLRFAIKPAVGQWSTLASSSVTFQLGSQIKSVQATATEVIFEDVSEISPALSIIVNGYLTLNGQPEPYQIPGLLAVKIDWKTIGVGAITIPVLPVSIIYAPVVDAQKKNQASGAKSITTGNTTTVSFTTQNSRTVPVDSQFQKASDIAKDMAVLGGILKASKNATASAIGTGLTVISSALGSSSATQNTSTTVTSQHSLAISDSESLSQTALASQGGPGSGDLIAYYRNARILWYSQDGKMSLVLLGADGLAQPTAQQLKNVLEDLKTKPPGTKDPQWQVDAGAIESLLRLDPFVAGGPSAILLPPRFVDVSHMIIEVGGGQQSVSAMHTISTADVETAANSTTNVENDSAGFLSFLGIGVTQNQVLQSQISQSSSAQAANGQTFSQQYTLNGNGNEYYSCEVYFDVVFGTFAFRDMTAMNQQPALSGTLTDKDGKVIPSSTVIVTMGNRRFSTNSDSLGQFSLNLPGIKSGHLKLISDTAEAQVEYNGTPIRNVSLQRH